MQGIKLTAFSEQAAFEWEMNNKFVQFEKCKNSSCLKLVQLTQKYFK